MKLRSTIQRSRKRRRTQRGKATNRLVLSAYHGTNADVFPWVLRLYVPKRSTIADVTYGKGVFWKNVEKKNYTIKATDLKTGIDCCELPYESGELDCLVFDPPYMHTANTAHRSHQNFERYYANNGTLRRNGAPLSTAKYHEAILELYFNAAKEARRVLKPGGVYIVKCQDEVCSNKQRLTHVEIVNKLVRRRWLVEDLFVVMRLSKPGVSRVLRQVHARKNHSYFLVFRKMNAQKRGVHAKRRLNPRK